MKLSPPISNFKLSRYPRGSIIQFYGENVELYLQALKGITKGHNGLDILPQNLPYADWYGSSILACTDGWVAEIRDNQNNIGGLELGIISPPEARIYYYTQYSHLSGIFVKVGQEVTRGQLVAAMGNSGFVVSGGISYWGGNPPPDKRGTHLHLSFRMFEQNDLNYTNTLLGIRYRLLNADNGNAGYLDPLPYLQGENYMSNAAIGQKQNSPEFVGIIPFTHPEALASFLQWIGREVPRNNEGGVDFAKIKPDYTLVPN